MIRIDVLPDDVLLEIFDFYVMYSTYLKDGTKRNAEAWQALVHVCQRWRSLVFLSPRRLNLQLFCTPKTPARDTLDVWPALPLIVWGSISSDTDNVIAALEQSNRVRSIGLMDLAGWQSKEVLAAMQVPFPELTRLCILSDDETPPVIPNSFLDGSSPRLVLITLEGISFPGLPKLIMSATHLVYIRLAKIPHSGYISPEAMVALLAVLSNLRRLEIWFRSPQSCPGQERRSLLPPKRSTLPALDYFFFRGAAGYLEEFVTHIDTPHLESLTITFFDQIDFNCSRLAQFINRTPTLRSRDYAKVEFRDTIVGVSFQDHLVSGHGNILIYISCREADWQLSSIEQLCNSSLHPLFTIEDLYIEHDYSPLVWKNDAMKTMENALWSEILRPFTAVKDLYISNEFALGFAATLQEFVGGRTTGVLPNLQNIFVDGLQPSGPFQEKIGVFVAARELSDLPIAISVWNNQNIKRI